MVVTGVLDLSSCDSTCGSNRKRAAIQLCSAAAVMTDITDITENVFLTGRREETGNQGNLGKPGKTG